MNDQRHRGDGEPEPEPGDSIEIDFGSPGTDDEAAPEQAEPTADVETPVAEDLWDDLPETEIEDGELDSDFFNDFEDVDAEVYEGIPTEEDIGADRETPAQEDDVVVEEDDAEIVIEEGSSDEDSFFDVLENEGWSSQQWSECAERMVVDARASEDASMAARLLAAAGRIQESRLGEKDEALQLYRSAQQLDGGCLTAIQGVRRVSIVRGDLSEGLEALGEESMLVEDGAIRDRIGALQSKITQFLEQGEPVAGNLASEDPYQALTAMVSSLAKGDASRSAEAAATIASTATDKLFSATVASASGVLAEMAGVPDDAARAYAAALESRESEELASWALWRMHVVARAWQEAEKVAPGAESDPSGPPARGSGFLKAYLAATTLNQPQMALDLLEKLPAQTPQMILGLLASISEPEQRARRMDRLADSLPDSRLRGILQYAALTGAGGEVSLDELAQVLRWAPGWVPAVLEMIFRVSAEDGAEHVGLLNATLEEISLEGDGRWLYEEAVLGLLRSGRGEEADRLLTKLEQTGGSGELLHTAMLYMLSRSESELATKMLGRLLETTTDDALHDAAALLASHMMRFDAGDGQAAREMLGTISVESDLWPHVLMEMASSAEEGWAPSRQMLEESIRSPQARGCIPAVLMLLGRQELVDPELRTPLLTELFEKEPSHLPLFAILRRDLLAAGNVETYGGILERWCEATGRQPSPHILGERIALLSLGAPSSLSERDLAEQLEQNSEDTFLPLFLVGLGGYPALGAEAAEKLASSQEGPRADRWWFEAARRWAGVDQGRSTSALDRISDPAWKQAADGLLEACSWSTGRWDDVAGRLIAAMKEVPEDEISVPILSRMVYVDGLLKGETSIALAEAESLLEAPHVQELFVLRFLYTKMLEQKRLDEATRPAEALARTLVGADEATAFAWLASRGLGDDETRIERAEQLVRQALEARAADLPLLFLADAQARRNTDMNMLSSVVSEMSGTVEDPREQGALLWVLAILFAERDAQRALSSAREAHERLCNNPISALLVEQLATDGEDWATAGMFARQAGSLTRESVFGVEDLMRAGEIYRDRLREGGWAVQCFEQAMGLDPSDERAFASLKDHFSQEGDWDHVATLLEERILGTEEPRNRYALLRELAKVYENADRVDEAIAALRRILSEEPEDPDSLSSLGALCVRTKNWEEAISALQERALLPMTSEQKVEIFQTLGGLYVDQVPDPKKAIVCFEKVLAEGGQDTDVIRQLADLYERTGAWEKGLRMAEVLFNSAEDEEEKSGWLVMAGRLWQDGGGDMRRAEQSYEMARKQTPGAPEPIVALVNLYRKQGDQRALSFHLERSMGDLLHFVQQNPGNMQLYHTVFEIARAVGDPLQVRIAGTLLESFFDVHPDEQQEFEKSGGSLIWNAGSWMAGDQIDEGLAPDSFTPSFRVLTTTLRDTLLKSVDYDPKKFGLSRGTRLAKRYSADTRMADEMARHFGIKPLTVHVTDLIPSVLTVLPDSPPVLVIGEPLYRTLSDSQKRFAFAWGCKLAASGLVPFVSMGKAGLPALWVALMQQFEPTFFINGVDADETVSLSASLRKNMPRKAREELFGAGLECAGDQRIDVSSLYRDISSFADRAALLGCGDMAGALQFVWVVSSGEEPYNSDYTASRALEESSALTRLVEFIISGRLGRVLPAEG